MKAAAKTRLIMKRLRDVKPGDVMVGRMNWMTMDNPRPIIAVHPSKSKPGKLSLVYRIDSHRNEGRIRRWPDFYVICIKPEQ